MPADNQAAFSPPRPIVAATGEQVDQQGNRFRLDVSGPEDRVAAFLAAWPVLLELQPLAERDAALAEQLQAWQDEGLSAGAIRQALAAAVAKEAPAAGSPAAGPPASAAPEAAALLIRVWLAEAATPRPRVLQVVVDPSLDAHPDYYAFADYGVATVSCQQVNGVSRIRLFEERVAGGWQWRCGPGTTCSAETAHTGTWLVKVTGEAGAVYSLTGDLYAVDVL